VSRLKFPILVKPSDSFSGKGIVKVSCLEELSRGIELARSQSGTQSVVFEEFIDGSLYSHSAFLRNGSIAADFFVNEYCTVHPYQVNSSHVCVDLDPEVMAGMRRWLEAFASALHLADGLVHTQFISEGRGFGLVEVMRRCPGDLYAMLIEKSTGVDYAGMYASAFCNSAIPVERKAPRRRFFSRHTVSVERDCTYFASGIAGLDAEVSFVPLKKTGEPLRAAPMDRAGIYFIEHASSREMKAVTPALRNHVTLEAFDRV
jgi:biotin carboxylase